MPLDTTNFLGEVEQDFVVIPDDDQKRDADAVRILKLALEKIERGWTRKAYARCFFIPLPSTSRFATRWCARGALEATGYELGLPLFRAEDMLNQMPGVNGNLINYNDKHTQADVCFIFKCAIVENTPVRYY